MGITVNWDNEQQSIIRYDAKGRWDWIDFDRAVERAFTMTESVDHTVDALFDLRKSGELPNGAVLHFRRWLSVLPANRGSIVVVSNRESAHILVDMLRRIDRKAATRLVITDSLDAARRLLQPRSATTPFIQMRMRSLSTSY